MESHEADCQKTTAQVDRASPRSRSPTASRIGREPDGNPDRGQQTDQSNEHEDH
jgi:hypothetical protein